ncbi:MAG: methyltransferase domain-containing protein [Armatimonadetes bacterium]|nr:methyltransferase domain-containing protein [Armatimonadota bacterium]
MAKSFIDPALQTYIESVTLKEADILRELREETAQMPDAGYQISPDQGLFMGWLAKATGAKRYLEIGVFTGYSSLVVAQAMGPDSKVVACDINEEFTNVAKRYWSKAGYGDNIELRLGPALDTLDSLIAEGVAPFDIAFIDPDKPNMPNYFERCLKLVRKGGLILSDNVLWAGRIIDPENQEENTNVLRAYNEKLIQDDRVDVVLLPIGDGISMAIVK